MYLLSPLLQSVEKLQFRSAHGSHRTGDKQNKIGTGDEFARDRFVAGKGRVCARRVDQNKIGEEGRGIVHECVSG